MAQGVLDGDTAYLFPYKSPSCFASPPNGVKFINSKVFPWFLWPQMLSLLPPTHPPTQVGRAGTSLGLPNIGVMKHMPACSLPLCFLYPCPCAEYIQKYATEEALKEQEEGTGDSSSESSMSDFSEDEAQDMEL